MDNWDRAYSPLPRLVLPPAFKLALTLTFPFMVFLAMLVLVLLSFVVLPPPWVLF